MIIFTTASAHNWLHQLMCSSCQLYNWYINCQCVRALWLCGHYSTWSQCVPADLSLACRLAESSSLAAAHRRWMSCNEWWFFNMTLSWRRWLVHRSGSTLTSWRLRARAWFCTKPWHTDTHQPHTAGYDIMQKCLSAIWRSASNSHTMSTFHEAAPARRWYLLFTLNSDNRLRGPSMELTSVMCDGVDTTVITAWCAWLLHEYVTWWHNRWALPHLLSFMFFH